MTSNIYAKQLQEPLSPEQEFLRALDLSDVRLESSFRRTLLCDEDRNYGVSLDTPTPFHQAYRVATSWQLAQMGKPNSSGEISEEFIYRLNPEALALAHLMGIVSLRQFKGLPRFASYIRKADSSLSLYTCADAEFRFNNVLNTMLGIPYKREPVDRIDIVLDKKRDPLFIKKYVDQQSALSLQDVLFRDRLIPAGTLFALRLDAVGSYGAENAERAIPLEDSKAVAFLYPEEAIQALFPHRLSMWFHRTPEERALFTYTKKVDDPNRKELVLRDISDFTDAALEVIS